VLGVPPQTCSQRLKETSCRICSSSPLGYPILKIPSSLTILKPWAIISLTGKPLHSLWAPLSCTPGIFFLLYWFFFREGWELTSCVFLSRIVSFCVSYFCVTVTKYLTQTTWRKEYLFWLMVSEMSVHHGVVEKRSWHHGGLEAQNRNTKRGRDKDMRLVTHFPHTLPPAFYHLPITSLCYDSIKGPIHWLSQSPQASLETPSDTPCNVLY
jgi:hypothetical protein